MSPFSRFSVIALFSLCAASLYSQDKETPIFSTQDLPKRYSYKLELDSDKISQEVERRLCYVEENEPLLSPLARIRVTKKSDFMDNLYVYNIEEQDSTFWKESLQKQAGCYFGHVKVWQESPYLVISFTSLLSPKRKMDKSYVKHQNEVMKEIAHMSNQ